VVASLVEVASSLVVAASLVIASLVEVASSLVVATS